MDVRSLGRYYDAAARFPLLTLTGAPAAADALGTLEIDRLDATVPDRLTDLGVIERAVPGYPRVVEDLRWILERREGYLYRRGG